MSELQTILSDDEALAWLCQQGTTCLSQIDLAKAWGWYEMRVSRRLRQWEDEGRILRGNGAITWRAVTAITSPYQGDNSVDNIRRGVDNTLSQTNSLQFAPVVSVLLSGVALALFASAVAANAAYAWGLGANDFAGAVFGAVGVAADTLVFLLPSVASAQWRARRRGRAIVAWAIYGPALAFALAGSVGFSALNIADVVSARAARTSPGVALAERRLAVALAQAGVECRKAGPLCRQRQEEERQALSEVGAAQQAVAAGADPQAASVARLLAWAGPVSPDGVALGRLALLVLLPQMGGLVLMAARKG